MWCCEHGYEASGAIKLRDLFCKLSGRTGHIVAVPCSVNCASGASRGRREGCGKHAVPTGQTAAALGIPSNVPISGRKFLIMAYNESPVQREAVPWGGGGSGKHLVTLN
jgi:hypothetical protein